MVNKRYKKPLILVSNIVAYCGNAWIFFLTAMFTAAVLGAAPIQDLWAEDKASDEDETLFLIANTQFTLCHEIGHALIAELRVPVMGSEEDFVDKLSAICFLYPRSRSEQDPQSVEKLLAVADSWRLEWELDKNAQTPAYWDIHSLDIQRFYNIVCLIYGSNPEQHADLPDMMRLPWARAWSCEDHEYQQGVEAVQWLLKTYGIADGKAGERQTGKVKVTYEPPSTEDRVQIQRRIQMSHVIENKASLVESLFSLPNDIRITVANCLGDTTSFWRKDLREVAICYALLERFTYLSRLRHCLALERPNPPTTKSSTPGKIKGCIAAYKSGRRD